MNLYSVPAAYEIWLSAVEAAEGELSPELEDMLQEIEGTILDKGDAVCALVRNAAAEAEVCREEARRFTERARQAEARAERLKALLMRAMQAFQMDKLTTGRFKVSIRTAGTPTIRWLKDISELPEWARRVKIELDGGKAQQFLKDHATLPHGFSFEFTKYLGIR